MGEADGLSRTATAPEGTSVTLTIAGDSGGRWSLLREGGEWQLCEDALVRPAAEVIVDQDVAWRLFTRGLDQSLARSQITVEGDQILGLRVLDMVSIIA